jgi:predicted acyltransferase
VQPSALSGRLVSLDAFRGLTVAAMILVNNPGSWSYVFTPLDHAPWHGWTPTDLIFPFFLFIVGVAIPFSFRKYQGGDRGKLYRRVLRRSAVIYLLGLFLSLFPDFDLSRARYVGVLPRIAIVYLVTAVLVIKLSRRALIWVTGLLLVGYWALMTLVPVPGHGAGVLTPEGNLAAWVDSFVVPGRMYQGTWDPEGLVSTIPAVATALLGVLTGFWLRSDRSRPEIAQGMLAAGVLGVLAGLAWNPWFPINKNLWTSSFVVFTAGAAWLVLAVMYWIIDVRGHRRWTRPMVAFGVNAISVYVLAGMVARLLIHTQVGVGEDAVPLKQWLFDTFFAPWAPPHLASLAFAIVFVMIMRALVELLYQRRIFIKV